MPLMLALVLRARALVPSMALMPLVLALVVRGGIHSMNGIDAPYVGSCSMNGADAPYVGSCCESTSIHFINWH